MINIKKIIPFKKDINFDSEIEEITSISLDHQFNIDKNTINGVFIIGGEYKTKESNVPFKKELPFSVEFDDSYIMDNVVVDIDDFYYEVDKDILKVSIDVLADNLEKTERCIEEEDIIEPPVESNEDYKSYTVYIVREGDTVEGIIKRYGINLDLLSEYNDIKEIKAGDKLIIPS